MRIGTTDRIAFDLRAGALDTYASGRCRRMLRTPELRAITKRYRDAHARRSTGWHFNRPAGATSISPLEEARLNIVGGHAREGVISQCINGLRPRFHATKLLRHVIRHL